MSSACPVLPDDVVQSEFAATADNAVIALHCSDKPRPADSSLAAVSNELLSMLAV